MKTKSTNTVEQFIKYLNSGIDGLKSAGKVLVAMIKHNRNIKAKILEEHPHITAGVLAQLERVGRGELHPLLLISDCPAYKAARQLPYSDQDAVTSGKIPMLVISDGNIDELPADPKGMTPRQVKQVFAKDHIRTSSEQRLYLEEEQSRRAARKVSKPYRFNSGRVYFRSNEGFSVDQLSSIISELARAATDAA